MLTLDVDPQTTILAPRPMPDEVLILACDADGAQCSVKMRKKAFVEITDDTWNWQAFFEDATAHIRKNGLPAIAADWKLDNVR
jgi:hypothetical protein